MNNVISVTVDNRLRYPKYPFYPDKHYPELANEKVDKRNNLYRHLRRTLLELGLDQKNYGTKEWNPLGNFLKSGSKIVIKPNWVRDVNPIDSDITSLVTNSSYIRFVIDYAIIALRGKGEIVIADAPLQACNFDSLMKKTRIKDLVDIYKNKHPDIKFSVIDLRKTILGGEEYGGKDFKNKSHVKSKGGDPLGYSLIDVGENSFLTDIADRSERFRVTMYDYKLMLKHHTLTKNEYLVANSLLSADLVVNIPKMKSHIKAGLTGALKNLVGINGNKEYLPHHIAGSFFEGGDQYIYKNFFRGLFNRVYDYYWSELNNLSPFSKGLLELIMKVLAALSLVGKDNLFDGGWYGNETIPRTTLDLNNIQYFYDKSKKKIVNKQTRSVITLVDGIVGGEGNGPLRPEAVNSGCIIGGYNPLLIDKVMAKIMGFNFRQIKTIMMGLHDSRSMFRDKERVVVNGRHVEECVLPDLSFRTADNWEIIKLIND